MVQSFINASAINDQVWLAAGTYKPNTYPSGCTNCASQRDYTFFLKNGVSVYGSFTGSETATSQRNLTTLTTFFNGDIGNISDSSDNCYHVVLTIKTNKTTQLNGLVIKNGYAQSFGNNTTVNGRNIPQNAGGGIFADSASLNLRVCLITNNRCSDYGAGVATANVGNTFVNTVFSFNYTKFGTGGALSTGGYYMPDSVINCLLDRNEADDGGGIYSFGSKLTIQNTVFTENTASLGAALYNDNDSLFITNCVFYSNYGLQGVALNNSYTYAAVRNCTFSRNNSNATGSAIIRNINTNLYLNYSVMWGDGTTAYTNNGSSNISLVGNTIQTISGSNPLFKNILNGKGSDNTWRTADDGLRPKCNSPLISLNAIGAPVTDISGFARNGTAECGAYEIIDTFYTNPIITSSAISICPADAVTFSLLNLPSGAATVTCKKNQTTVATGTTCQLTGLANGDSVFCTVTSTDTCSLGTFTSNKIKINVATTPAPAITISVSQNSVCVNTQVTFTASSVFGGSQPIYQWKKNGNNVGTGLITYTDNALANGDIISCELTSSMPCFTNPTGISNSITMIVNNPAPPVVTISTSNTMFVHPLRLRLTQL